MLTCPSCKEETLPDSAQHFASMLFPAKCIKCNEYSGIKSILAGSLAATVEAIFIIHFMFTASMESPTEIGVVMLLLIPSMSIAATSMNNYKKITEGEIVLTRVSVFIFTMLMLLGTVKYA